MREKSFRLIVAFVLITAPLLAVHGQSNETLDDLLNQRPAQMGHTAYLVLTAAGLIEDDASPEEALAYATDAGFVRGSPGVSDEVTFGRYSYLLMKSFGVRGGVMYMILPGPRYAAREVVYRGWSRTRRAPSDAISGNAVVRITSVYLNQEGGE